MQTTILTRRRWLSQAAGCATALALGDRLLAADQFSLRYLTASSLYGNLPLETVLAEVKKTGSDSIDLWPKPHGTQREEAESIGPERFAALLEKYGVKVGMTTRYDLGALGLQKELPFAKRYGVKIMISGVGGPVGLQGAALKSAVGAFVEKLKPNIAAAQEAGIIIGVENHAKCLIDSPDSIRYLADLSPSSHLGVALAPYHLPQDPSFLAQLIRDLGPKLVHFYAWQHGKGAMTKQPTEDEMLQLPGRGTLDFVPILAALKQIAYRGWTSVFMHPFPRGFPILPTAGQVSDAINVARRHLDAIAATL